MEKKTDNDSKAKELMEKLEVDANAQGFSIQFRILVKPALLDSLTGRERKLVDWVAGEYLDVGYSVIEKK